MNIPSISSSYREIPPLVLERMTKDDRKKMSLSSPPGLAAYVARTGRPLLIPGCALKNHVLYQKSPHSADALIKHKTRSILLVPVYSHQSSEPIAVLQVSGKLHDFKTEQVRIQMENCLSFNLEDQILLTALANMSGPMLVKSEYYTRVEMNREKQEILLRFARKIFNCVKLNSLSNFIMSGTKDLMEAERCTLFVVENLMNSTKGERLLYAWKTDIQLNEIGSKDLGTIELPFGVGLAGAAAEGSKIVNVPDAYRDSRFNRVSLQLFFLFHLGSDVVVGL